MTPDEAMTLVIEVAEELRDEGVQVRVEPLEGEPRVGDPLKIWRAVVLTYLPGDDRGRQAIVGAVRRLNWRGITFDMDQVDRTVTWRLDWSLQVQDGPDGDHEEAVDWLDEETT